MFRILNRRDSALRSSLVSDEKAADEISATGGRRRLSPIDVFTSPAIVGERPGQDARKKPTRKGWAFCVWSVLDSNQ